jgi:transcriptional regulator with XRE-family HTH domain
MGLIEIGKLIKDRRDFLAINQEDLSEMTGITAKTIYLIENGKANPSFITLSKLLDILGLEIIVQIKKVSG